MTHIYIDADACPVKDETYKVAKRYNIPVTLVANTWMTTPDHPDINLIQVGQGFDEADQYIIDHIQKNQIVITTDIPLASECLKKEAHAINPKVTATSPLKKWKPDPTSAAGTRSASCDPPATGGTTGSSLVSCPRYL